jgi:transcriptional regulator with XRE-family HTH domain
MTPGGLIKAVRRRQGLTQAELARRAGTSQPVVSAYEHDRRDPTIATLAKLVAAGGERLQINASPPVSDLPPARDPEERNRRLLDVLSLADAVPRRRRDEVLNAPRMISS